MSESCETRAGDEVGVMAGLTQQQSTAASTDGPVLVLAGAGTGKTTSLTAAVVHRITKRRIPVSRILAVTFTNKAAGEMLARIRIAPGEESAPRWIGTFHGLCARQLRTEPEVAGLRPGFDIMDADDTRRMIKRVMKAVNTAAADDEGASIRDPIKLVCNRISSWKDELITAEEAPAAAEQLISSGTPVDPQLFAVGDDDQSIFSCYS